MSAASRTLSSGRRRIASASAARSSRRGTSASTPDRISLTARTRSRTRAGRASRRRPRPPSAAGPGARCSSGPRPRSGRSPCPRGDGVEQALRVARRAGEVGAVVHHQHGARDAAGVDHAVGAALVVAPLREPGAQRGEAAESDRAVVRDPRVAQIAGAGPAVGRVLRGIGPAHVAHRAVDDEGPLGIGLAARPSARRASPCTRAVMRRLRAICAARKRATNARRYGGWSGQAGS